MMDIGHYAISLLTLLFLEIVLGIDNLVFVSIASQNLKKAQQKKARQVGLMLAMVTRLLLLALASFIASLQQPLFSIAGHHFSGSHLLFIAGGVFLLYKGTEEVHAEFKEDNEGNIKGAKSFAKVITQIALLDIVFSFDSVITAIGMTKEYAIMATAIILSIVVMILASHRLSEFIEKNPTVKMLALSFILMVGMILIADGFNHHIPRGYIYFAITFSLFVESMNILLRQQKSKGRARKH